MTLLVAGGAGFIGSALVRALAAAGFDARVLDDLSSGSPANLEGTDAELVTGDVRDLDLLIGAARGCDVVFHLAAGAGVVESMRDPLTNFDQNARGTLTALEAARRADVPRLVFSSSNAPLGENAYPASEDKPVAPLSPYGASKATGEAYCSAFHGAYGMDAVVVRFSNAYGPRSAHKGNVIPLFIRRLRAGEELVLYGDGSQTRDFVFVGDVVRAILAGLGDGNSRLIANVGTGGETSVLELARAVNELCGNRSTIEHAPPRAGEILKSRARVDRLRDQLGVVAQTKLHDGLKATLA